MPEYRRNILLDAWSQGQDVYDQTVTGDLLGVPPRPRGGVRQPISGMATPVPPVIPTLAPSFAPAPQVDPAPVMQPVAQRAAAGMAMPGNIYGNGRAMADPARRAAIEADRGKLLQRTTFEPSMSDPPRRQPISRLPQVAPIANASGLVEAENPGRSAADLPGTYLETNRLMNDPRPTISGPMQDAVDIRNRGRQIDAVGSGQLEAEYDRDGGVRGFRRPISNADHWGQYAGARDPIVQQGLGLRAGGPISSNAGFGPATLGPATRQQETINAMNQSGVTGSKGFAAAQDRMNQQDAMNAAQGANGAAGGNDIDGVRATLHQLRQSKDPNVALQAAKTLADMEKPTGIGEADWAKLQIEGHQTIVRAGTIPTKDTLGNVTGYTYTDEAKASMAAIKDLIGNRPGSTPGGAAPGGSKPGGSARGGRAKNPPNEAAMGEFRRRFKANPQQAMQEFDEYYGQGAAARALAGLIQ